LPDRFNEKKKQKMLINLYKQSQVKKYGNAENGKTKYENVDDRIVLYRLLGHIEIANAHVWKIDTGWWIWDKWKYTCVITNAATIGGTFKTSDLIDQEQTGYLHQKIIDNNKRGDMKISGDNIAPKITGSFNNWKCTPMMKFDTFYDWLLRNNIPAGRTYIEDKPQIVNKISKILNQEIFTIYKNRKRFVSHIEPTIIGKLLQERKRKKLLGKRIKEKEILAAKDIHK
jgi:hypothetical protein